MCRDAVILFLQCLGFVIDWKKSVLTTVQEIEYFGLTSSRNISHRKENVESKNKMSKLTDRIKNIEFRIDKSDSIRFTNLSNIVKNITMMVSSAVANSTSATKLFFVIK